MSVLGVIPARWGSTRFPGKPLCRIAGKPMIQWVWERARLAKCLEEVLVATDDDRIADACRQFGAKVVMTSAAHPTGTDRVAEVARTQAADCVVNIQGDEPLLDPAAVSAVVERLQQAPELDMTTAAVPDNDRIAADPNIVKVVVDREGRALYFSRAPIPYWRDRQAIAVPEIYRRHIGLYAYRRNFLLQLGQQEPCWLEKVEQLEQLRALYIGGKIGVVDVEWHGIAVDVPKDVIKVERLLEDARLP